MILSDWATVVPALEAIGLNHDELIEVIRYADGERALCNLNDPKGFGLVMMNARAARGLRQRFCGADWQSDDTDNQAGIRNPRTKIRVIHCNFDKNAGNRLADPTNFTEKGSASRAKVRCNQTGWLTNLPVPSDDEVHGEYTTYVLGTFYDKDTGTVRAELSRPKNFASGQYTDFYERIILLTGSEGVPIGGSQPVREGPTEIIDIAINRK